MAKGLMRRGYFLTGTGSHNDPFLMELKMIKNKIIPKNKNSSHFG